MKLRIATLKALLIGSFPTLVGCAGPTSPLGAVWAITPSQARGNGIWTDTAEQSDPGLGSPLIRFSPDRQVLHGPSRMRILVEDPQNNFSQYRLAVRYNGMDVTESFLKQARIRVDRDQAKLIVEYPRVRLGADAEHLIEVAYQNSFGGYARALYEPPVCYAFKQERVDRVSSEDGFNPAFSTGLIAQESGFNPRALSWARALGLTQVTPTAEEEILQSKKDFPRYPGLNDVPLGWEKAMIVSGKVNSKNEWRLNQEQSVEGGLEYAKILAKRWGSPENTAKIRGIFHDPDKAYTQLILASYQSGYARVSAALARDGVNWLKDPDLNEARKYVNRISSFCHSFSNRPNQED
jgi:soluble lytic murein transglycosylase-like protein